MKKEVNEKWIRDTALIFYQIFSVDYEDEMFENKLLQGGGGNSTLCSTWTQLSDSFTKYRISKKAYNLLINIINADDRNLIMKTDNCVTISSKIIKKKYPYLFSSNQKGSKNRKKNGQYFHFDHNPPNKTILELLKNEVRKNIDKEDVLERLTDYIKQIQTVDLITVEEDEIRTNTDKKLKDYRMTALERDEIIDAEFYDLDIVK